MQDWYGRASPKNDDATKVRSVEDISPRKTFVWQHGYSNLSHKLDKAPRLSIRRVIWILASDTVFVKLNQYSQILRWQCCLMCTRAYMALMVDIAQTPVCNLDESFLSLRCETQFLLWSKKIRDESYMACMEIPRRPSAHTVRCVCGKRHT